MAPYNTMAKEDELKAIKIEDKGIVKFAKGVRYIDQEYSKSNNSALDNGIIIKKESE